MKKQNHPLRTRLTALLLALICILGLLPTAAFAAADTITLKEFGHSGVAYQSAALGRCTLHEMSFSNGNKITTGFCGTKGGGMGTSLQGQTWGGKTSISNATVETMMKNRRTAVNEILHGQSSGADDDAGSPVPQRAGTA